MPISSSQSKVCFFFQDTRFGLRDRNNLKKFVISIFKKEGKRLDSLNYIFCTDKALLEINRRYLQHDDYTDIITFELSTNREAVLGEIYISVDRVRENARTFGVSFKSEIHRVIFHGALHLCGFGDKTGSQKAQMRQKEAENIEKYFKSIN